MSRILLLVDRQVNRRLLEQCLAARYEIVHETSPDLDQPFDLCILDGMALVRLWRQIEARKTAEAPVVLPFLLITSRQVMTPGLRQWWHEIDEVIRTPIEKVELYARVEMLLRVRRLSLELQRRAQDLSARLGRVLDDSPNEIFIFDAGTLRIVQVNQGACRGLGYSQEELLCLTPPDLLIDLDRSKYEKLLQPLRTGEQAQVVFEVRQRRRDGTSYPVEVRLQLSRAETPPVFVSVNQDITDRKRLEEAMAEAHRKALQVEVDRRLFAREVLRAVTRDRFLLVDLTEIPTMGELVVDVPVQSGPEYRAARQAIERAAQDAGLDPDAVSDLVLAAGEAISNAMKHAVNGRCQVYRSDDAVLVRVSDRGTGIRWEDLPATILTPGFSTKVSLGLGYTLMLELVDRVWLSTGVSGTTIQLEKLLHPRPRITPADLMEATLERMARSMPLSDRSLQGGEVRV